MKAIASLVLVALGALSKFGAPACFQPGVLPEIDGKSVDFKLSMDGVEGSAEYLKRYKLLMGQLKKPEEVSNLYAFRDFEPVLRKILRKPFSSRLPMDFFRQMLMSLIKRSKLDALASLLDRKNAVEEVPNPGESPKTLGLYLLSYSITIGNWEAAMLISNYLDIDWRSKRGTRILVRVCGHGSFSQDLVNSQLCKNSFDESLWEHRVNTHKSSHARFINCLINTHGVRPSENLGNTPDWAGSSALYAALVVSNDTAVERLVRAFKVPCRDLQGRDLLEVACKSTTRTLRQKNALKCLNIILPMTHDWKIPPMLVSRLGRDGLYTIATYFLEKGATIAGELAPNGDSALSSLIMALEEELLHGKAGARLSKSKDALYLHTLILKHKAVEAMICGMDKISAEVAVESMRRLVEAIKTLYGHCFLHLECLMFINEIARLHEAKNQPLSPAFASFYSQLSLLTRKLKYGNNADHVQPMQLTTKLHVFIELKWHGLALELITSNPSLLFFENHEGLLPLELVYRDYPDLRLADFVKNVVKKLSQTGFKDRVPVRPGTKMDFTWDNTLPYADTCKEI